MQEEYSIKSINYFNQPLLLRQIRRANHLSIHMLYQSKQHAYICSICSKRIYFRGVHQMKFSNNLRANFRNKIEGGNKVVFVVAWWNCCGIYLWPEWNV